MLSNIRWYQIIDDRDFEEDCDTYIDLAWGGDGEHEPDAVQPGQHRNRRDLGHALFPCSSHSILPTSAVL